MPRTGSCWPSLLWLHCTGRCRNSWHRKFSPSSSESERRPCNSPGCNSFPGRILFRNTSRFGLPVLLLFWISRSCLGAKNMPYCFQEHRHPNSLVTDTGSTWWHVLQTKAEDHYYMPVLSSRVRLKGWYEVPLAKPIELFFDLVHQWRKFPPKWLGFGDLIMTSIRTATRDRKEVSSIIALKKEERTFSRQ